MKTAQNVGMLLFGREIAFKTALFSDFSYLFICMHTNIYICMIEHECYQSRHTHIYLFIELIDLINQLLK